MRYILALGLGFTFLVNLHAAPPRSLDDRLVIELVATEPEIVTPTGIEVDKQGRIYCIECNTHFRPEGYAGPPTDRIRVFDDFDETGRARRINTFYEGTSATMGLKFDAKGEWLYVVSRSALFRVRDADLDGVADERLTLAVLKTTGDYPHNGLNGCVFDSQGRVYFGQGENLGVPWELVGRDGRTISGGDGGRVYRCNADGTGLEQVAEGCWNPFGQCFDRYGNLFVVDNDPDNRPPCRLLHVVPGADFGYRFSNGRKGLHPFSAWNGDLPGALPMAAGTGEAPSTVLSYEANNLPSDYRGQLIVPSWGDHRLDRYALEQVGASFRSAFQPFIVGDEDFRPVGTAVAPDGSIVISDWVDKSYELHSKGRIWRIRTKSPNDYSAGARLPGGASSADTRALAQTVRESALEQSQLLRYASDEFSPLVRAEALRRLELTPESSATIFAACRSSDPFLAQAARRPLLAARRYLWPPSWLPEDRELRLTYLLVAKESQASPDDETFRDWLADSDEGIRMTAVRWVGEAKLEPFREELAQELGRAGQSPRAFATVLAALERLDGVKREVSDEDAGAVYVAKLLADPKLDLQVLQRAVPLLPPDDKALTAEVLGRLFDSDQPAARRTAIHVWSDRARDDDRERLFDVARDSNRALEERVAAVAGIRPKHPAEIDWLVDATLKDVDLLAAEALRSLRTTALSAAQQARVGSLLERNDARAELAKLALPSPAPEIGAENDDVDAWLAQLAGAADAAAGERVFFHPQGPGCFKCHQVAGRGAHVGPDLTATGRQLDRRRLIASIITPSAEVAPQFTTWNIATHDGIVRQGVLVAEAVDGTQTYLQQDGAQFDVRPADIAERRIIQQSIMPEAIEQLMTLQEFRDLAAYLEQASE